MASEITNTPFTRRGFLGVAGGVAAMGALAACSPGGAGGSASGTAAGGTLKFWNMPWGPATFNTVDEKIVSGYKPEGGLPGVSYQVIQWANFTQTFASAVASGTGPAVSSGGGSQAFQFAHEGQIAYADNLVQSWKQSGLYDDFLDGVVDTMKTNEGYAAVPYQLDVRCAWYNKSLLAKAGVDVPTTWDEYEKVCAALKKIGVYGLGMGNGSGNLNGTHVLSAFMINNGGGFFNASQEPDVVTDANIEAVDFVLKLVKAGYSDPAAATYTSANEQSQWGAKQWGFGWSNPGLAAAVGGDVASDLLVGEPLASPSGKKGSLYFVNNIMMYKNTPSQEGSEAFLTFYVKNMSKLWTENSGVGGLPVLKSIVASPEFQKSQTNVDVMNKWVPICRTFAAPGGTGMFYNIANTVDGTQPVVTFAQEILGGNTDAKTALTKLQQAIEGLMK